jgi:uronate dehydrogenase
MSKVLVTGSAGAIGQPVCRELERRGHQVRALDLMQTPGVRDAMAADITDAQAVKLAASGVDCIIHLAAIPTDAPFERLVGPNVIGLYNVMNAAREAGAQRVVLASSVQVVSRRSGEGLARVEDADPGNHYGLTKLWAEQMGAMYFRHFGLSVLAVRIGWVVRNLVEVRRMREVRRPDLYLSHADAARFFTLAIEAPDIGFAVVYAVGRGGAERFDMEPARRLIGFEPKDVWPEGIGFEVPEHLR